MTTQQVHKADMSMIRRASTAALVGTTIEWYDFFIYSTAAALVFNKAFFPDASPLIGTLLAFATFGVGFVMRPAGAVVFGHFGDKVGRKSILVLTLFIMGGATFLIGLLPTFSEIGILAPILLVFLRLLQGFAIGGEWGGAVALVVEHAPPNRRGFYGSFPQLGVPLGFILSTVIFLVVNITLPDASWGWRIPFLLSAVLILVGMVIRLRIEESPMFREAQEKARKSQTKERMPIVEVFRSYWKQVLLALGLSLGFQVGGYLNLTYMLSYGTTVLGLPNNTLLIFVGIISSLSIPAIVGFCYLSDIIGRRKVFMFGAVGGAVMAFPLFLLVNTKVLALVFIGILLAALINQAMSGPVAALFSEMFNTKTRYSGASMGYQVGAIIGGGFAPFIATALFAATGTSMAVAGYLFLSCAISAVCVLALKETAHKELA
ncbi:MAG: MFS transporter [Nocardiopsaceae bacterium]|nr:MFS transporter [Nocardiopsaceae bacterium]